MKKVCIITTEDYLYDGRVYWREAVSLVKNGYDVTYVGIDDEEDYDKKGVTEENVKYYKINLKNSRYVYNCLYRSIHYRYAYDNNKFIPILEILKKDKFDIIHIHGLYSIYMIRKIRKINKNVKIIYECREYYPDSIRDYNITTGLKTINKILYSLYMSLLEKIMSSLADKIIVIDQSIYQRFKAISKDKTHIIYNFTNMIFSEKYKTVNKEFDIVYCGGMTKVRGIMQIIKSVKCAKDEGIELKCLLIGPMNDLNLQNEMNAYINKYNLHNNISYIGKIKHSDVANYLCRSKIGIVTLLPIPKYKKNIPMKQFEYMTFGLPIVGSDLKPIRKFVEEADCGILVNPMKEKEIWNAIKSILINKELYNKLSLNGIRATKDIYNWKNSEKKLIEIYNSIF